MPATATKVKEMFDIQNKLNELIIGKDYKKKNIPFYRAIVVESAELIDHIGFKWWHKKRADLQQIKLEIVDIWHFLMSHILAYDEDEIDYICELSTLYFNKGRLKFTKEQKIIEVENLIQNVLNREDPIVYIFFFSIIMRSFMTFDDLYRMYVGKNALNYFRQMHGYKEGKYNKNKWKDKYNNYCEDNVVLAEILEGDWETFDDVYSALKKRYPSS